MVDTTDESGVLAGRRALVTGASRGLGLEIGRQLHVLGAEVWFSDIHIDDAAAAAAPFGGHAVAMDVTDSASVAAAFDAAAQAGQLDILVNNAGVSMKTDFLESTEAQLDLLYRVNVRGPMLTMQEFARRFQLQAVRGKIVNITSTAATSASIGFAMYAASKAGTSSLTKLAGKELAGLGINVNGAAPGIIDTPLWQTMSRDDSGEIVDVSDRMDRERYAAMIPLGRVASPDDVARVVCFLASPTSDYMIGEIVTIDGGMSA